MKVKLTYSDMTLIVGVVEKELKERREGIARMKSMLTAMNKAAENGAAMCEEMEMKEEELQNAIMTDLKRCSTTKNIASQFINICKDGRIIITCSGNVRHGKSIRGNDFVD